MVYWSLRRVVKFLLLLNMADMGCFLCEVSKAEYLVHSVHMNMQQVCVESFVVYMVGKLYKMKGWCESVVVSFPSSSFLDSIPTCACFHLETC